MTTPGERLQQVYEQIDLIKKDMDYPDRDRVMKRLRKERRKLEKQEGIAKPTKSPIQSQKKTTGKIEKPKKTTKKTREKKSTKNLTAGDASEKYLDSPPEHIYSWLSENGYKDRRDDPTSLNAGILYCTSIERIHEEESPTYIIEKFEARWGQKPDFFTILKQGRITMLAMGPCASQFI